MGHYRNKCPLGHHATIVDNDAIDAPIRLPDILRHYDSLVQNYYVASLFNLPGLSGGQLWLYIFCPAVLGWGGDDVAT